jgi:scyllo-inositol 2-dehydrogenase (NADP+)
MLADETIELIIVSTPAHLHFEHAKMALEHNKHVVIEKPFAATLEEAKALKALAESKGKVAVAYQNRRFDGDFLTIQSLVNDPEIQVYEYEAVWDRFEPEIKDDWHEAGYLGADLLFDLGPHYLDQALTLFGPPVGFHGTAKRLRPGSKIIDYFSIELNYPSTVVRLKSTLIAAHPDIRYKVHTSKGTYHFYEMGEQEHQLIAGITPDQPDYGDNAYYDLYDFKGNKTSHQVVKGSYMTYFTKLAQAIRTGSKPPVTIDESIRLIGYLEEMRTHII